MSVRQMGAVFELGIPASWKLVLLAMADHARDDGTGCYPSIETLARKTSQSRRGVQKIMRQLEEAGLIAPSKVSRGGPRRSTEYTITLANSEPRSLFASAQPRTPVPATANASACNREPQCLQQRTGFALTIKNHQEPSENLARLSPRSSQPPCGNVEKPKDHRARYSVVRKLTDKATELLQVNRNASSGDLAEELKTWGASQGIPYSDAWPGAASPIEQAITNAIERRKTA